MSRNIKRNVILNGHIGTFYEIDNAIINGRKLYLMESEKYGDLAPCVIVNEENHIIMENVFNGFDDYEENIL